VTIIYKKGALMKKFDISNVIISRICDIYSYTLPEDTEGDALTAHSVLIIKRKGSSDYTVNGKKYPALPGFKKGYFKGKSPAFGALQQHEDMAFFKEKFRKTSEAMKMLSTYGIKMPVPGVK
jgi:hypothetical protein